MSRTYSRALLWRLSWSNAPDWIRGEEANFAARFLRTDRNRGRAFSHMTHPFFSEASKVAVKGLVEHLEATSAAELVVAVHPESARYREAEWLLGVMFASAWLTLFLYLPEEFDFTFLPIELLACLLAGMLLARSVAPIKRWLTRDAVMQKEVTRAARAAFVERGVSHTQGRTGILVYASILEGRVAVVPDRGVPMVWAAEELGKTLDESVRRRDVGGFVAALQALRPELARVLPRRADDDNELADELIKGAKR